MRQLKLQLMDVMSFWQKNTEIKGALVSVHYIRIIAKVIVLEDFLVIQGRNLQIPYVEQSSLK